MKIGKSVTNLREENRALLLETLYFGGAASRKGLAAQTGLTAASVTQLTSQLIAEGVVAETEKLPPQNRTGRAEQLLDLDRAGLFAAGVVLSDDGIMLNLSDLDLNLIKTETLPMKSEAFSSGELSKAIDRLAGERRERLVGIGVSVRGSVDPIAGVSVDSYGLLPKGFSVAAPLSAQTGLMVTAENNVRSMLTAHTLLNPRTSDGVVLFIKYGPGVGGALMIDGRHFSGSRFTACEVGHICAVDGGERCVCGKRGCLETLLRYDTLVNSARVLFSPAETPVLFSLCGGDEKKISAESIFEAFSLGDAGMKKMLDAPLSAFAVTVASCKTMYDPDTILLCSEVFKNEWLAEYLSREIAQRCGNDIPQLRFISNRAELGAKSGAAAAVKAFLHSGAVNFN